MWAFVVGVLAIIPQTESNTAGATSTLGDPGMRSANVAVGFTAWSFCNGARAPTAFDASPSPRMADCVVDGAQRVTETDNSLGPDGGPVPGYQRTDDVDLFAREKEYYLAKVCTQQVKQQLRGEPFNFSGWQVMFKSGIMDSNLNLCPCSGTPARCTHKHAGPGSPMNQPLTAHGWTDTHGRGFFAGTYDSDPSWNASVRSGMRSAVAAHTRAWVAYREAELQHTSPLPLRPQPPLQLQHASFLFTAWRRNASSGKRTYYSLLRTSERYPWLMNYLRANDASGGYGGYPWGGTGLMRGPVPASARVLVTLRVLDVGSGRNLFYLPEISGCWKLDGSACDGALSVDWPKLDVTRYICFILAPSTKPMCSAATQHQCPPWHILSATGEKVYRNDTERFPYSCYMMHCYAPHDPTAPDGETCDPWSNPNPQELMQLLPCSEWALHGFPSTPGEGWIGDARLWRLDAGLLGSRLFLQGSEPQASPAAESVTPGDAAATRRLHDLQRKYAHYPGLHRRWISFEIGPEQMQEKHTLATTPLDQEHPAGGAISTSTVRWEVEDWDVVV